MRKIAFVVVLVVALMLAALPAMAYDLDVFIQTDTAGNYVFGAKVEKAVFENLEYGGFKLADLITASMAAEMLEFEVTNMDLGINVRLDTWVLDLNKEFHFDFEELDLVNDGIKIRLTKEFTF